MTSNRGPVAAGAVLTVLSTGLLFVLPDLIPLQDLKLFLLRTVGGFPTGNPFTQLRFLGGIPGALLAGYLARSEDPGLRTSVSVKAGVYAALLGLGGVYGFLLGFNVVVALTAGRDPALFTTGVVALALLFPLVPLYLFEGVVFGPVGNWLRRR